MSGYDEGWRQQQIEIEQLKGRVEQATAVEIDPVDPATVPDDMLTREAVAKLLGAHKALTAECGRLQALQLLARNR